MQPPEIVEFESEFFGEPSGVIYGKVLAIFRDSEGSQWAAFECEDMLGVHLIPLCSRFLKGLREEEPKR
jgi:hypothetical protein